MSTHDDQDDRWQPKDYARSKASKMWLRARMVFDDAVQLPNVGFPNRSAIERVVMLVTAGDRLHPAKGFDFLGNDWVDIDESERFRLLDEREAAVEEIVDEVVRTLVSRGYSAAQEDAKAASPFQVVFLSDSEQDTEALLLHLLQIGLGTQELSDCDFGKRGAFLYFRWDENLSYFLPGDYGV
jgi:hypothetical protein